jgi:hypothetical protein
MRESKTKPQEVKAEVDEIIRAAVWVDNYKAEDGEALRTDDRVYISFSKIYKTGTLTEKQVDAIVNELTPVMFSIITNKLQEFHLLPSCVKRPQSGKNGPFSFLRKGFTALLSKVHGNG